jgi:hypothetical protein
MRSPIDDIFTGVDNFGGIVDRKWLNYSGTPTTLDEYAYGYDLDSNRTWKQNTVGTAKDEYYTYDNLNRLTDMQRGTLNGSYAEITGTPVNEQPTQRCRKSLISIRPIKDSRPL